MSSQTILDHQATTSTVIRGQCENKVLEEMLGCGMVMVVPTADRSL